MSNMKLIEEALTNALTQIRDAQADYPERERHEPPATTIERLEKALREVRGEPNVEEYRDLHRDKSGAHEGKPCDACGKPIGSRSYSTFNRKTGETISKLCRKGCGKFPDPLAKLGGGT